jgi:hypothetical protein
MKKIGLGLIASLLITSAVNAQIKKEGFNINVAAGVVGVSASGSFTDSNSAKSSGTLGKETGYGEIGAGYTFSMGGDGVIDIGASYVPVKAKISGSADSGDVSNAQLELSKLYNVYIQPGIAVGNNTSIFATLGYSRASVSGTNITISDSHIHGVKYGVGERTFVNNNTFVQVEASLTDYKSISGSNIGGTNTATAKPKVVAGLVSVGYKF